MKFKRKIIILALLIVLLAACLYILPGNSNAVNFYDDVIYYPIQSLRNILFGFIPFSIGDIVYVLGGVWALFTLVRWGYFIVKFRSYKERFAASVLRCINCILFVYLFFILGWGGNYYKRPLGQYWHLNGKYRMDTASLISFDRLLSDRLNIYAGHYHDLSQKEINERARSYYGLYTDSKVKNGLNVKPSLFGYFMERMAIEGYYNPFTGEGQVNNHLPSFIQPFVICHEMAHQAGIAAEGDANLMSYALCTISGDSSFCYSAYLNIWLYTNSRLYFRDSALAKKLESSLNLLTRAHIDTLDKLSREYQNEATKYSGQVYDSYLRMQHQKEGIHSYGNVVTYAWQLEQRRTNADTAIINIP